MGSGIAQVSAQAGYRTIVREVDDVQLAHGLARVDRSLAAAVQRGKLPGETRAAALDRLSGTTRLDGLAGCDLLVEAIVEDREAKAALFREVDAIVAGDAILASNTSSLCITELAAAVSHPERVLGLHFFSPVPIMRIVEVARALETTDDVYRRALEFVRTLGKDAVTVPDQPGFIVNRLLIPYLLNAIRAHESGLGSVADIDRSMRLGCGHPMGPFALLDFVGLDTACSIADVMYGELHDPAYAPPPLLRRMVLAGRLGRKSGRGFYDYP